ncbi:MAG: SLBB domain-containing protein [Geothrix sp.]|uniref:SLBB domain-containing protein n=1 Tax=Geothrix sp. TaxID=1962974 RepID=UPI0017C2B7EE|nr:SLBB domain-containing protein [Geothrix sp.]NWJ41656.1 SLBB domain-containing protein [Geothrix sp.]WIL20361.1 MAG: SLBB domain-containing protein [Geothrix sp.]
MCTCLVVGAQTPSELDLQNLKQYVGAPQNQIQQAPDATPNKGALTPKTAEGKDAEENRTGLSKEELQYRENAKAETEIKALKARDKGPRRFAADLFDTRQANPSATTDGGIAEDYVLGAGDVLSVNVYGSATFDVPAQVDGRGEIVIPKVGSVKVAGLSLGKAKQAVQGLVARQFSRANVDLQVMKLREVRVFVLGEVYKGGSFLVSSLSSLVNVLGLSGGPTSAGSFRDIRVVRGGQVIHHLDLYPLRAEGRGNVNFSLQSGDVIFVPIVGIRVLMEGAFLRVAAPSRETGEGATGIQLELKGQESALDAVRFMGGLLPTAYSSFLTLQRVDPNGVISVQNIPNTDQALRDTRLFFNDVVRALVQTERTEGVVEVAGRIRVPGRFAHKPGLRVRDLLAGQEQLLPDTYLGRGELVRTYRDERQELLTFDVAKALEGDVSHNLALEPRDRLTFYTITDFRLPRKVTVIGPFTHPGTFDWFEGMRASDLVFRAGIPQLSANRYYAELAHTKDGKPSQVLRLDLERLLSTEAGSPVSLRDDTLNPRVDPYDTLSLYEKPDYRTHRVVHIGGQVARPGTYVLDQDKPTLSQLIQRAGGLTPEAMPKAGIFLRSLQGGGDPQAKGVADILGRLNETKLLVERETSAGQAQKTALFRPPILHGLSDAKLNRMVVNFEGALKGDRGQDVEMLDGDDVIIPRQTDAAYVVGETASPFATYKVVPGSKVADLLKTAGGLTRNADSWNIRLVKADGRIVDSWVNGKTVEPGDTVIVPQRIRRDTAWQDDLAALTPIALLLNAIRWR